MRKPRRKRSRKPQSSTPLRFASTPDATAAALARLPVRRGSETWDVALMTLPATIREGKGLPYRPMAALCAGSEGGVAASELMHPDALESSCLLDAIAKFALKPLLPGAPPLGYLPARVRMPVQGNPATELLEKVLVSTGVSVQRTDDLPYFRAAVEFFDDCAEAEDEAAPLSLPGLMTAKGMTIEHVRGCAEAMALFCAAAPWRTLDDEVLWCIQPAPATRDLRMCVVTGGLGEQFGLAFLPNVEEFEAMHIMPEIGGVPYLPQTMLWSVMLEPLATAPEEDIELWRREGLPLCELPASGAHGARAKSKASSASGRGRGGGGGAGAGRATVQAIPLPVGMTAEGHATRPTPAQLLLMEGLLRGFAAVAPSELRSDAIRFAVQSSGGPQTLMLRRS